MEELDIFVKALTIFVLALFVGFEVIRKVPPCCTHHSCPGPTPSPASPWSAPW